MPKELPKDIWREIAETHLSGKATFRDLSNLTLTNKRLRGFLLEYVYHALAFTAPSLTHGDLIEQFENIVTTLERRTRGLQEHPHLLSYVRVFSLVSWSCASRIPERCKHSMRLQTAIISIFDKIGRSALRMHGLRKLELWDTPVTELLHYSIVSCRSLETLSIFPECHTRSYTVLGLSPKFQIQNLQYVEQMRHPSSATTYLMPVLKNCLRNLLSLSIQSGKLEDVLSLANGSPLSLQTLTVECVPFSASIMLPQEWKVLCCLFPLCPELRRLEINLGGSDLSLTPIDADILPKLTSLRSSVEFLEALIPGRPVRCIYIHLSKTSASTFLPVAFGLPPSSVTQIQHLMIDDYRSNPIIDDFTTFHNVLMFKNLKVLKLKMMIQSPGAYVFLSIEEFCRNVALFLQELPYLQICHVSDDSLDQNFLMRHCPIAETKDPNDRGHPSLERVELLSYHVWRWNPSEGWTHVIAD